jgi:cobalt-zinc-cadmium efflux system membrane fusion protein
MTRACLILSAASAIAAAAILIGCSAKGQFNAAAGAPPKTQVIDQPDLSVVKVAHPERFKLVAAAAHREAPRLNATGVITPAVDKSIPVISLASGRVIAVYAKLGDEVRKGQLLLKVFSNDVSTAFQNYSQAKADESLAGKQLERAKTLYDHGAISLNDLQVAQDAETKAAVSVTAAEQQLRNLGGDPKSSDPVVNIYAPASGTIVEQNVVQSAAVHTPDNQPNLFTIANLSTVWAIADVYENDLPMVRLGDAADVELNAYLGREFRGRIDNISKVLDPATRTAKVRIVLTNPGIMRSGMFVTVTFRGQQGRQYANIPATAVLHLHDRDWVFVPVKPGEFRRTEVTTGDSMNGGEDILSGISPGQQVVSDALALSAETEQ